MTDNENKDNSTLENKDNSTLENKLENIQNELPFVRSLLLKSGAGSVLGYCCGVYAKQVSKILIFYAGIGSTLLAWLSYCNYITINWKKLDSDIFHIVAKAKNDRNFKQMFSKFFTHTLPLLGTFVYGFKWGFEQ